MKNRRFGLIAIAFVTVLAVFGLVAVSANALLARAEPAQKSGLAVVPRLGITTEPVTLTLAVTDTATVYVSVDLTPPVTHTAASVFSDAAPVDASSEITQQAELRGMVFCEGRDAQDTNGWLKVGKWIVSPLYFETASLTYTLRPTGALDEYDFGCYLYYTDDSGNHEVEALASINIIPHRAYLPGIGNESPEQPATIVQGTARRLVWAGTQGIVGNDTCEDAQNMRHASPPYFMDEKYESDPLTLVASQASWQDGMETNFNFEQTMVQLELPPDWAEHEQFELRIAGYYEYIRNGERDEGGNLVIAAADWDGELPEKGDWDNILGILGSIPGSEFPQRDGLGPQSLEDVIWTRVNLERDALQRFVRGNTLRLIIYDEYVRDPSFCELGESLGGLRSGLSVWNIMSHYSEISCVALSMR